MVPFFATIETLALELSFVFFLIICIVSFPFLRTLCRFMAKVTALIASSLEPNSSMRNLIIRLVFVAAYLQCPVVVLQGFTDLEDLHVLIVHHIVHQML